MKADGNGVASGSPAWCLPSGSSAGCVHTLGRARLPTVGMWGTVGAVGLVWATDWRLIMDWVPYINGKFKKDD
ncbi:cytochrome b-c1 complex subunit 10 isoform 1-T1 [Megaptera novaeangliae]